MLGIDFILYIGLVRVFVWMCASVSMFMTRITKINSNYPFCFGQMQPINRLSQINGFCTKFLLQERNYIRDPK